VSRLVSVAILSIGLVAAVAIWHTTLKSSTPIALQAHFGIDFLSGIDDRSESRKFAEYRFLGISSQKLKAWVGRLENRTAQLAHEMKGQHSFDSTFGHAVRRLAKYVSRNGKLERQASGAVRRSRQELSAEFTNLTKVELPKLVSLPTRVRSTLETIISGDTANSLKQGRVLSTLRSREAAWNTSFWKDLGPDHSYADRLAAAAEHELRIIRAGGHSVFHDLIEAGTARAAANISAAAEVARPVLLAAWSRFDARDKRDMDEALEAIRLRWARERRKLERPADAAAAEVCTPPPPTAFGAAQRARRLPMLQPDVAGRDRAVSSARRMQRPARVDARRAGGGGGLVRAAGALRRPGRRRRAQRHGCPAALCGGGGSGGHVAVSRQTGKIPRPFQWRRRRRRRAVCSLARRDRLRGSGDCGRSCWRTRRRRRRASTRATRWCAARVCSLCVHTSLCACFCVCVFLSVCVCFTLAD
jgi:hypothetical protein